MKQKELFEAIRDYFLNNMNKMPILKIEYSGISKRVLRDLNAMLIDVILNRLEDLSTVLHALDSFKALLPSDIHPIIDDLVHDLSFLVEIVNLSHDHELKGVQFEEEKIIVDFGEIKEFLREELPEFMIDLLSNI